MVLIKLKTFSNFRKLETIILIPCNEVSYSSPIFSDCRRFLSRPSPSMRRVAPPQQCHPPPLSGVNHSLWPPIHAIPPASLPPPTTERSSRPTSPLKQFLRRTRLPCCCFRTKRRPSSHVAQEPQPTPSTDCANCPPPLSRPPPPPPPQTVPLLPAPILTEPRSSFYPNFQFPPN